MIRMGLDLGSNWIKCSIMNTITKEQLFQRSVNYKLVKSFDEDNNIPQYKIDEVINIINDFIKEGNKINCQEIRAVATAGLRKANNSKEFIDKVHKGTNVKIQIISGAKEANYTWNGALLSFEDNNKLYVEIDIGGASTEITYGMKTHIMKSKSIPIGSALLLKKFNLIDRNVTDDELNGIFYFLNSLFSSINIPVSNKNDVIYILTGSSGFLPIIKKNPSMTDTYIKSKPLWVITMDMVYNLLKDLQVNRIHKYNKNPTETDLSSDIILYFLMRKLGIDKIYYSTLGLRHGLILS